MSFSIITFTLFLSPYSPTWGLFSKNIQRTLILHLSYLSLTYEQWGVCSFFFAALCLCSKKKTNERGRKKKRSPFASPCQSQTFWTATDTPKKNLFQTKGASGSLKMDPHPLLMSSLPCLFCFQTKSTQREGRGELYKILYPHILLLLLFPPALLGGGALPLWCHRDGFLLTLNSALHK